MQARFEESASSHLRTHQTFLHLQGGGEGEGERERGREEGREKRKGGREGGREGGKERSVTVLIIILFVCGLCLNTLFSTCGLERSDVCNVFVEHFDQLILEYSTPHWFVYV